MLHIIRHPLPLISLGLFCLLFTQGCDNDTPALDVDKGKEIVEAASCEESLASTCPGASMPEFSLMDFQPGSERLGEAYGLQQFKGEVTLVALLASW